MQKDKTIWDSDKKKHYHKTSVWAIYPSSEFDDSISTIYSAFYTAQPFF